MPSMTLELIGMGHKKIEEEEEERIQSELLKIQLFLCAFFLRYTIDLRQL
jgi:hypothetical protein